MRLRQAAQSEQQSATRLGSALTVAQSLETKSIQRSRGLPTGRAAPAGGPLKRVSLGSRVCVMRTMWPSWRSRWLAKSAGIGCSLQRSYRYSRLCLSLRHTPRMRLRQAW